MNPISEQRTGPEGPARRVAQENFGSVSRRSRRTEPAEAPVEGEEHALDVDIDIIAVPELVDVFTTTIPLEVAVVVEIVEIGEAILAADRQIVGELPLDAAAEA